MAEIDLGFLKCQRCGHVWIPRRFEVKVCPKCSSPYWDRPRGLDYLNQKERSILLKRAEEELRRNKKRQSKCARVDMDIGKAGGLMPSS